MPYQFTQDQLNAINADYTSGDPHYIAKTYATVRAIVDGQPGVDPKAVVWLQGAEKVNLDIGPFSDFIRDYTDQQHQLRYGAGLTKAQLDAASERVGRAVIDDILQNHVMLSLDTLGAKDAAGAVAADFGGDQSAWSGDLLFSALGDNTPYLTNIIGHPGDSYNLLASSIAAAHAGPTMGFSNWGELGGAISDFLGTITTIPSVAALEGPVHDFITATYNDKFPDPLVQLFSTMTVGTIYDDTITTVESNNIVNAGAGDDTLVGSTGFDLLDGGQGRDTVTFAGQGAVTVDVRTDPSAAATFVGTASSGLLSDSNLFDIETIRGSAQDDQFFVHDYVNGLTLDGSGGTGDLLSFADLSRGVTVNGGIATAGDKSLNFSGFEKFEGSAHDDKVTSTVVNAQIRLGAGNDTLAGAAPGTQVWGGDGADTFYASPNIQIEDADGQDKIYGDGGILTGGIYWKGSADPYAMHISSLVGYGLNKLGDLVIHDFVSQTETFIAHYIGGPGAAFNMAGVYIAQIEVGAFRLFEQIPSYFTQTSTWEAFLGAYMKANFGVSHWAGVDPLVFDLDGDGLELAAKSVGVPTFDIDGDGYAENSGWVSRDDGFLAVDANGDGQINDVNELFGGPTSSGFAKLATYDTNHDGIVNASDTAFGDLRIWRDLDQDQHVDPGELMTLAQAGVASISVAGTSASNFSAGNQFLATGSFTRTDGTTGQTADVSFAVDNHNTVFLGDKTISTAAAALPELKGYGTLPDLRVAMTLSPTLQTAVSSHLPDLSAIDLVALRTAAVPILTAWAQASPVTGQPALVSHDDIPILLKVVNNQETVSDFVFKHTESGGGGSWYELASGAQVHDSAGAVIDHPTLLQIQADTSLSGTWSTLGGDVVGFFERYLGESIPLDAEPTHGAGAAAGMTQVINGFWTSLNSMSVRLAIQGPLAPFFPGLAYDVQADGFDPTTPRQLIPSFEAIFDDAKSMGAGLLDRLDAWKPILDVVIGDYHQPDELLNTNGFLFSNIVAAYESKGLAASVGIVDVAGALGLPEDLIRTGPGAVAGGDDADLFYLSAGDQTMSGGLGPDTYVVGHNFGHDVINDLEPAGQTHSEDVVRFADIASTQVTAHRDGIDLVIDVNGTSDELRIVNHFDGRLPGIGGGGDLSDDTGVNFIVFSDGVTWTPVDMARAVSRPDTSDQTITGTDTVDWLDGGAGNDSLTGGSDADVYVFGRGYGNDTISDANQHIYLEGPDIVLFKPGVTADDLTFSRNGASDDLVIRINGDAGSLTILNQFAMTYTGPFGAQWIDHIESFKFADGTELGWQDVIAKVIQQSETDGDDQIYGFSLEDDLAGGKGNDFLSGGNEDDTYRYNLGDGHDTISEGLTNITSGQDDRVVFGVDIDPATVQAIRLPNSDDLQLTFADGGSLVVQGQFTATGTGVFGTIYMQRVESFQFANGDVWTAETVTNKVLAAAGTPGNDTIDGAWREDRLDGGAGDDLLRGKEDSDTYVFGRGYGHDTVYDSANLLQDSDTDAVEMKAGVAPSDIVFERNGTSGDFTLRIAGTDDRITLQDQNTWFNVGGYSNQIEQVKFADGTVWTAQFMRDEFVRRGETSGDDTINGFSGAETLAGGAGNDLLAGGDGGDTYEFNLGDGQDTIAESLGLITLDNPDQVVFGAGLTRSAASFQRIGDDLKISFAGSTDTLLVSGQFGSLHYNTVESFKFADGTVLSETDIDHLVLGGTAGNDTLLGTSANDTLDGGAGNDYLEGRAGADTYVFDAGYGHDVIRENNGSISNYTSDVLQFGGGITPGMVRVEQAGYDLHLTFVGLTDDLTIQEQFLTQYTKIDSFHFADGTVLTEQQLLDLAASAGSTPGSDTLVGTNSSEAFSSQQGDDSISAMGGNDTLTGGTGNDTLNGGDGDDHFVWGHGDGSDLITDGSFAGSADQLVLQGVNPGDVTVGRSGGDVLLTIAPTAVGGSDGGVIKLVANIEDVGSPGVDQIVFANGALWTHQDLRTKLLAQAATSGNDSIAGFNTNDTLTGGAGNDSLNGGAGDDSYVWARGDGADVITETSFNGAADKLVLTGVNPGQVTVARSGADVILTIAPSVTGGSDGGSVKLIANLDENNGQGIDQIVFADATTWTRADLRDKTTIQGTAGADTLTGTNTGEALAGNGGNDSISSLGGNDTLTGGTGADSLNGGADDDVYVWAHGDGADVITETSFNGANDKLVLQGVNPGDVSLVRSGGDVTLNIAPTTVGGSDGGSVKLVANLDESNGQGVDQISFADGTTWTRADLRVKVLAVSSTGGSDSINGFNTNDTITAGAGADTLNGQSGDDSYIWAHGDGADLITETSFNGTSDKLVLQGVNPGDVSLVRSGGDVTLNIAPTTVGGSDGGSVKLVANLDENNGQGVDQIVFADGTTWTRADLRVKVLALGATTGNDSLNGFNTNDTITGGAGADSLNGQSGDDNYIWARGDGADVITETSFNGTSDKLVLQGVNPADVSLVRSGGDVTLNIAPSTVGGSDGGSVKLVANLDDSNGQGVDQISFADGTTWTRADLRVKVLALGSTTGSDSINGFNTNDTITAGAGNDSINGQSGDDNYIWAHGDGADVITETWFNGTSDKLVLQGVNPGDVSLVRSGADVTLNIAPTTVGGSDGGSVKLINNFDENNGQGVDQISFADGTTWTRADLRAKVFALSATSGNDSVDGFNTNDTITGGAGNDTLNGQTGDDNFVWAHGDGADVITETWFNGTSDKLVLQGVNPGDVSLVRSGADVTLNIAPTTVGGSDGGSVKLVNNFDENNGQGVDQISFADGTNWTRADLRVKALALGSTSGADSISGFNTNDTMTGGGGADTLTGGAGADQFRYLSVTDAPVGTAPELITDFVQGTDHIDLSAIDANSGAAGDQAFSWLGTAAFSNVAGQLRYDVTPAGARTIFGDIDGDGHADFQIQVTGSTTFAASDFIL